MSSPKITKKERRAMRMAELARKQFPFPPLTEKPVTVAEAAFQAAAPVIPIMVDKNKGISIDRQKVGLIAFWTERCQELLQQKGDLTDDDKLYLSETLDRMRDEKLKGIFANLLGWGDDERAEMQTFCAIALEVMSMVSSKVVSDAAKRVEARYYLDQMTFHEPDSLYYDEVEVVEVKPEA